MVEDQNAKSIPANSPSISSTQSCTVEYVPRHLRMHTVSENELDAIASGSSSLNLTFFGVCFGAAISFSIVLYNGGIDVNHKSMYDMLLFAATILSAYFGVRGGKDYFTSKGKLDALKKEPGTK
jgi:hypothetical protein